MPEPQLFSQGAIPLSNPQQTTSPPLQSIVWVVFALARPISTILVPAGGALSEMNTPILKCRVSHPLGVRTVETTGVLGLSGFNTKGTLVGVELILY